MMYFNVGENRFSAWPVGIGLGVLVVGSLGLWSEWRVVYISGWSFLFMFLIALGLPPAWVGLSAFRAWSAHNRLDVDERQSRLYQQDVTTTQPAAVEPDAHALAWRDALIEFVLWSESLGALTSTAHIGHSVSGPDDWEALTNPLLAEGWIYKTNGVPTSWHPGWSPARAVLAIMAGKFSPPPLRTTPPRVPPCPVILG